MYKVVLTGPESSGKTTLAQQLSDHFGCPMEEEYAREYLGGLGRKYKEEDLMVIYKVQKFQRSDHSRWSDKSKGKLFIYDTDGLTLEIWSKYRYGNLPAPFTEWREDDVDLYLLCSPDFPWEPDPLREHPFQRERLFLIHQDALIRWKKNYKVMSGPKEERLVLAIEAINDLIKTRQK